MSMYDIMTGGPIGPVVQLVLSALMLTEEQALGMPRFRDAYLVTGADGAPRLGIITRTGGGNRSDYVEENALMETFPGFIETMDLDIDTTYALWEYAVSKESAEHIARVIESSEELGVPLHPRAKMEAGLERVKAGHVPPELRKVVDGIEAVVAGDDEALEATGLNVRREPNVSEDGVGEDIKIIEL